MIDFIAQHWLSILIVLVFIATIVILMARGKKEIVYKMLHFLVTEAEQRFGNGTGFIKFAYVLEQIYEKLPLVIRLFITYDTMEQWIENALVEAKEHWAKEAGILQNNQDKE